MTSYPSHAKIMDDGVRRIKSPMGSVRSSLPSIRRRLVERLALLARLFVLIEPFPPFGRRLFVSQLKPLADPLADALADTQLKPFDFPLVSNPVSEFLGKKCHNTPPFGEEDRKQNGDGRDRQYAQRITVYPAAACRKARPSCAPLRARRTIPAILKTPLRVLTHALD